VLLIEVRILQLSEEAQANMKAIRALENKYHYMAFRMAFTYLVEIGHTNFDDASVEKEFQQILAEEEAEKASDTRFFLTPDFKREILCCAIELANYSVLTLFAYIKKYL